MSDKTGVLDSYHLAEVLKPSAVRLGGRCGAAAVSMLARRYMECVGAPDEDRFSYVWRSAIEEHEQDANKDEYRGVLVDALRDAALGASSVNSEEATRTADALLSSEYSTLVRVGIFVCGERYKELRSIFWRHVKPEWFLSLTYWHELFWFIKKAFAEFSDVEKSQFLHFVDAVKGNWTDQSRQEEWDEGIRRDILHPAVGQGDSALDAKYTALVARWGPVRDNPDFHSYTTSGVWAGDRTPVTSDALVGMSNEALTKFLAEFVPDPNSWDGATYRGLAAAISGAVRASEDGFVHRIHLFANLARPYQHGLLRGLAERWSEDKREIDWQATLGLIHAIVSSPAFSSDLESGREENWDPSIRWVIGDIAALLKAGARPERQLSPELCGQALEIIKLVLSSPALQAAGESKDAVSRAINSPRGQALEALIQVALALRRQELADNQIPETCWATILPVLEAELTASEAGLNSDFATLCGLYCGNLHYLNGEWTEKSFDRMFSISNDVAWRCAAQGFSYQKYLYPWLFKKLVGGGHLKRMVYEEGLPRQVADRALQFLALAYLEGQEEITGGGLLWELVTELKVKELSHICWFFWTLRVPEGNSPKAPRILQFWDVVANRIAQCGQAIPELQAALSQLSVFIDDLTGPVVDIWATAAPHAHLKHHGPTLIRRLAELATKYPKEVATVFRSAISTFLPEYQAGDVIQCVKRLAEAGEIDDAEWICNAYAAGGSMLLKETYEEIRVQQRGKTGPMPE